MCALLIRPDVCTGGWGKAAIRRRFTWRRVVAVLLLFAGVSLGWYLWHRRYPAEPTEIFQGVTYGCERLKSDSEGSGLVHWVKVDLTAPGLEL